jgi:hypothetical protein
VSIPRRWAVILWVATAGLLMFSRLRASGQASSSLSDEEIFQLLVPDHKSKAEKAAAHPDEPAYSPYRLEVAERLETDFGIAGKHYSLVAVQEMTGFCGSCYPTYFGIIDRDSGNLAWSYLNIGLHGSPNLGRGIRLRADLVRADPVGKRRKPEWNAGNGVRPHGARAGRPRISLLDRDVALVDRGHLVR